MSDLISRSELLKELKSLKIVLNGKQIFLFSDDAKDTVLRIVNEQPTAYDVSRVVEELERFSKLAEDRWVNGTSNHAFQECKCWAKAIEIVKQEEEQYNNGWIPCSERLPEETFGCLVTVMD